MLALETTLKGWAGYGSAGQVLEPLVLDHFNTSQEGHILVLATQPKSQEFIVT
jgi:homospermidine synthase